MAIIIPAVINLADLDGSNGFVLQGIASGDYSGVVRTAGDINGDGFADVIIGAWHADPNSQVNAGESYVVFGGPNVGVSGVFNLSSLNGSNGFVLQGIPICQHSCPINLTEDLCNEEVFR